MPIKIEDKSSVKKVLSFEIPKEDITKELNIAYNELKKQWMIYQANLRLRW